ncbi:hypothetical protein PMAYCL1PPCAC_23360, partial [Pristionchus mayeri]
YLRGKCESLLLSDRYSLHSAWYADLRVLAVDEVHLSHDGIHSLLSLFIREIIRQTEFRLEDELFAYSNTATEHINLLYIGTLHLHLSFGYRNSVDLNCACGLYNTTLLLCKNVHQCSLSRSTGTHYRQHFSTFGHSEYLIEHLLSLRAFLLHGYGSADVLPGYCLPIISGQMSDTTEDGGS